jgi:tetratricopeptide (TPR) repeat protein
MKKALISLILFTLVLALFNPFSTLFAGPSEKKQYFHLLDQAEAIVEDDPEQAMILLNQSLLEINEQKDPVSASKAWFLMGEAHFYQDEIEQTITMYLKAVGINIASGNDKTTEHINILGNLGYMYDRLDQRLIAMDFYEQALKIAREIGDIEEIAANLANIGQLKTIQGFYDEAIILMEEALAIDREIGDESTIATDLNTIGRIYDSWGMSEKAIDYFEQALEIDIRMKAEDKMAIRYNSLGLVYKGWGKFDKALEYFNKALEIDSRLGRQEKVALRRANIGSTYLAMNLPEKAITYLETSKEYFIENELPSYMATTMNDLGRCYHQLKDYRKAEGYYLQSVAICREYNLMQFLVNTLDNLAELYNDSKEYEKAFTSLNEFTILNDSLFNAESQKKVAEFQAKYELDKKQREYELLQKDHELAKKRQMVVILVFSISALFLALLLLGLLVRLKSNQNRRLLAEKENEELKQDLEQRNRELTYNAMCIIKNNETVAKIAETIELAIGGNNDQVGINNMVRRLQHIERENNWTEFEVRFTQVHEDFYKTLNSRFPDLTPNEKKLCAFLRLNMSTKDIAAITHQSVHSLNVARTRLRKKLGIDQTDENLVNFLANL